jgi:hypothetical protein
MPTPERFQFFVVTRTTSLDTDLQRVSVSSGLQASLSQQFLEQSQEFTAVDVRKRSFCGTYKPNKEEVVTINPFPTPPLLERAASNPQEFPDIQMPFTENGPLVKAILGVDDGVTSGKRRFFFQHFDKTHVLKPKKTFLFQSGMFHQLTDPGVTISDHLTAVIVGRELLFRSFQRTNQFLDLTAHFKEATDAEIKTLLRHPSFSKTDSDAILGACKPAMRKKFSAILFSKVLDHEKVTSDRIQRGAKKFGIALHIKVESGARKLVFPENTYEAMKLLQYLAEELFISDLTEQPCETNSHRPLDLPAPTVT